MSSSGRPGFGEPGPSSFGAREGRAVAARRVRVGFFYALGAYLIWGGLPLYFLFLAPTGAFEIVAWRVIFSLVFCALIITVVRGWPAFLAVFRQPRLILMMGLAGALIYVNWQTYVLSVVSGHVVEASLGYFINPVITILLGVFVLRETLRPLQWAALVLSTVAVVVLALGYGAVPWIALILAFSFGLYGLVKKHVGPKIDAVNGLTLESLWLVPVVVIQLCVVGATTGLTFGQVNSWHTIAMVGAGVITAVPLLLFASATKRLPLIVVGFVQYLTPIIQFVIGVVVLREPMPPERLAGFVIVWLSLVFLSVDVTLSSRSQRRRNALQIANDLPMAHTENTFET
ncbi:EamA family transporter RarD [Subtercola frigoramans]|uniref:Chloramphenicol-sensitive protein RarD n=1 Tax=Subtercola frigoramans TaxID=120298 RepID=A0ABS2L2X9_9MICO|nr:EamA family transporter RarD [Subtercola frigoramans]MBM7471393.1 chloramphenicol-sensitive protein RarD [Subtercola frigoramans]